MFIKSNIVSATLRTSRLCWEGQYCTVYSTVYSTVRVRAQVRVLFYLFLFLSENLEITNNEITGLRDEKQFSSRFSHSRLAFLDARPSSTKFVTGPNLCMIPYSTIASCDDINQDFLSYGGKFLCSIYSTV